MQENIQLRFQVNDTDALMKKISEQDAKDEVASEETDYYFDNNAGIMIQANNHGFYQM